MTTKYQIREGILGDGSHVFRIYYQRMKRQWVWDRLFPRRVDVGLVWEPYMVCSTLFGGSNWWHASKETFYQAEGWVKQLQDQEALRSTPERVVKTTELP